MDDQNWADPGELNGGRSHHDDRNGNDDGEGEEDTQGGENGTGKEQGLKDGIGNRVPPDDGKGNLNQTGRAMAEGIGKGKGNRNGEGIVKETPGGEDISDAVELQLQNKMYEAESDTEGYLE